MNAIFHNDRVQLLGDYLTFLDSLNVDGVVFGDPAVIMAAKETGVNLNLHWSTETTGAAITLVTTGAEKAHRVLLLLKS